MATHRIRLEIDTGGSKPAVLREQIYCSGYKNEMALVAALRSVNGLLAGQAAGVLTDAVDRVADETGWGSKAGAETFRAPSGRRVPESSAGDGQGTWRRVPDGAPGGLR